MSQLRNAVDDYLRIRRALGFKLERAGHLLPQFVAYLERAGAETITTEPALAWAKQPPDVTPRLVGHRMSVVRGFARHLQALDPGTEVPPIDLLPRKVSRATPYLYTHADVAALMDAARALHPPLRAATYETLVGLLVVTGTRIGEATRLGRDDLDWTNGLLTVRDSSRQHVWQVPRGPAAPQHRGSAHRLCESARPALSSVRGGELLRLHQGHPAHVRCRRSAFLNGTRRELLHPTSRGRVTWPTPIVRGAGQFVGARGPI